MADERLRAGNLPGMSEDAGLQAALTPESLADPLKTAGKVAVAAALATTLAAGPVAPEKIHLPDPVPIVHVIDFGVDQPAPDQPADQASDHRSVWKKIMKFILVALFALLTAAGVLLGAAKGCVGTLAPIFDDGEDAPAETTAVTETVPATEATIEASSDTATDPATEAAAATAAPAIAATAA